MNAKKVLLMTATSILTISCVLAAEPRLVFDIGPVPIGDAPADSSRFVSGDCALTANAAFEDCTGVSDEGLHYVFFGGALSKVTARAGQAADSVQLPAGVKFNDRLDDVLKELDDHFGIELSCVDQDEKRVCASDFVFRSSVDVLYSLELSGGGDGRLVQVVARTDY